MVEDNGLTTNFQPKSFDGSKASFEPLITYFEALLMVKNLSDDVLSEFESELPATKTAESLNTKQNKAVERNKIAMNYLGMVLVSSQWTVKVAKRKRMNGQAVARSRLWKCF